MKPRTFIVFGGCHVKGYGVKNASSFVNYFSNDTGLKCMSSTANFQIKKIHEVSVKIEHY